MRGCDPNWLTGAFTHRPSAPSSSWWPPDSSAMGRWPCLVDTKVSPAKQLTVSLGTTCCPTHSSTQPTSRSIISSRLSRAKCWAHSRSRRYAAELLGALHEVGQVAARQGDPPLPGPAAGPP